MICPGPSEVDQTRTESPAALDPVRSLSRANDARAPRSRTDSRKLVGNARSDSAVEILKIVEHERTNTLSARRQCTGAEIRTGFRGLGV